MYSSAHACVSAGKRREQKEGRKRERGRGLGEQNNIQNTKKRKGVKAGKKRNWQMEGGGINER